MAGGIDLVNQLKAGRAVGDIIHLTAVSALRQISDGCDLVSVGAAVTHAELAASPVMRRAAPTLAKLWSGIANIRVQHKGTIGGNLMARDCLYDLAPVAMALGAELAFVGSDGRARRVPAFRFDEIDGLLISLDLPGEARVGLIVQRSLRPVVSLAIGFDRDSGLIGGIRVAIGCAYRQPRVWPIELPGPMAPRDIAAAAVPLVDAFAACLPEPIADWRASSAYRREMIAVLLRRSLHRVEEAVQ